MKYYKAIYCGNGKCYNLLCVFVHDASELVIKAVISQLHQGSWAVIVADVDTAWPKTTIELT